MRFRLSPLQVLIVSKTGDPLTDVTVQLARQTLAALNIPYDEYVMDSVAQPNLTANISNAKRGTDCCFYIYHFCFCVFRFESFHLSLLSLSLCRVFISLSLLPPISQDPLPAFCRQARRPVTTRPLSARVTCLCPPIRMCSRHWRCTRSSSTRESSTW